MIFADLALARRLEAADAAAGADYTQAYAALFPDREAAVLNIMGGTASFAGVDSPMTQAFALGLHGAVTADELDELEAFYFSRGAAVNIELCPLADESLRTLLNERGYRVVEFSNVLVRELKPGDAHLEINSAVNVRQAGAADADVYGEVASRGFFAEGDIPEFMKDVSACFARMSLVTPFLAEIDGQAAACGGVAIHEGIASLAGAGTLKEFRSRGAQTALLRARIAHAARAGCDLAMVTTMPGTISYRNAARQGFQIMYTRCKLMKKTAT